ncbi:hypothetical protein Rsub_11562 [Raphidocelis subcapitata]|uniref:Peptidase A1 domain-containing protein n=1 Tax=Raphidocelis subcapitata TaxID=307507 RepID=A0A2V0PGT4_9CHLO|nr:hypothetical protein Rsub_11562 [Raphidocelis subcapitata]|eukprot:GBF98976.1 hypothetical protein Rsub_11562 [Raphidocelis subcapitata]
MAPMLCRTASATALVACVCLFLDFSAVAAAAGGAAVPARVLRITVQSTEPCVDNLPTRAVKRDLRKLLRPLDRKAKPRVEAGPCVAGGSGGASYEFVVNVTTKAKDAAAAARALTVSAQINDDFAAAMPRTAKALGATSGGAAAWQLSHVVELTLAPAAEMGLVAPVRQVAIDLGAGSEAKPYSFAADTGSPLLGATCNTPTYAEVCGRNHTSNFDVSAADLIPTKEECDAAGIGCWQQGQCWYSQALTGGEGYNSPAGLLVRGAWAFRAVVGLGGAPLEIPYGTIACAERYMFGEGSDKKREMTACPPPMTDVDGLKAECPGVNHGMDAGFTFKAPDFMSAGGKIPSAVGVPQQVYEAGLIAEQVLSFCWTPRPQNADCSAKDPTQATNFAVFGPATPTGLDASSLVEASLVYWPQPSNDSSSEPATAHFYSAVAAALIPKPNGTGNYEHRYGGGGEALPLALWDTGAGGASSVPQKVLDSYLDFYTAMRPAVEAAIAARFDNATVQAEKSKDKVLATCGSNTAEDEKGKPTDWVMNTVELPPGASGADVDFARAQLASLFPETVELVLSNGVTAAIPGSFLINGCGVDGATTSVSVCSFLRASTGQQQPFWFAVPWFEGRFVQFDVSAAVQNTTQYGVMRFTTGKVECSFDTS